MTDFSPIIEQVANILNITTDLAKQLLEKYPELLREYQFYQVFDILSTVSMWVLVILGIIFLIITIGMFGESDDINEVFKSPFFRKTGLIIIASLVVHIISKILIIVFSPHIHFIMEYLKSK